MAAQRKHENGRQDLCGPHRVDLSAATAMALSQPRAFLCETDMPARGGERTLRRSRTMSGLGLCATGGDANRWLQSTGCSDSRLRQSAPWLCIIVDSARRQQMFQGVIGLNLSSLTPTLSPWLDGRKSPVNLLIYL